MTRSMTLKVTLKNDEVADFLSALNSVALVAGDCALDDELRNVVQLDWLIGEFQDQLDGRDRGESAEEKR